MRVTILAIGKLGRSPEAQLTNDYVKRATASGRVLGVGPVDVVELETRRPGRDAEGAALLAAVTPDAYRIICDERGYAPTSRDFAERLRSLRDTGVRRTVFILGGADGLSDAVRDSAGGHMAFGPQTWPHALVRVMLAEQIYRAVTLIAGSPYHRD